MELFKVQFRKSRLEIEQEKAADAAAEAAKLQQQKLKQDQQPQKPTRDGNTIHKCRHCDGDIILPKNKAGKLIIADARHFFTPIYEGEEWVRHACAY
jgi:hypothetical protein